MPPPTSLGRKAFRTDPVPVAALLVCALLCTSQAFLAAPAGQVPKSAFGHGVRTDGRVRAAAGVATPLFSHMPWQQACGAAFALVCAGRYMISNSPQSKGTRRGQASRKGIAVLCSVPSDSWQGLPAAPRADSTQQDVRPAVRCAARNQLDELAASTYPLIDLQVNPTTVVLAAAPCPRTCCPQRRQRMGAAARRVGGVRFRGFSGSRRARFVGGSAKAASAARSGRASRQRIGSRLRQAETSQAEASTRSFDISRVRSAIQNGLQVTSGTAAAHGREHKSAESASPDGRRMSGVLLLSKILVKTSKTRENS